MMNCIVLDPSAEVLVTGNASQVHRLSITNNWERASLGRNGFLEGPGAKATPMNQQFRLAGVKVESQATRVRLRHNGK